MIGFSLHHCSKVSFERYYPSNGNCVTLQIVSGEDGRVCNITFFDLPDEEVAKFREGFGHPRYLTTKQDAEADVSESMEATP